MAAAPVSSRTTGEFERTSLFDLDAPIRPGTARTLEPTLAPVTATPTQTKPQPAARRAEAPSAEPARRRSAVDALFAAEPTRPLPSFPEEATTDSMPLMAAGLLPGRDSQTEALEDEEHSSLDELAELGQFPGKSSTVEILVAALGQPEIARLRALEGDAPAVEAHHEDSFDLTLVVPKLSDSPGERKSRLVARMKTTRSAFRVLGHLDITDDERKELLEMFMEYETRLKAAARTTSAKKDLIALHRALPVEMLDDLERQLTRIEDRLLVLDEYVPRDKFRARITKEKHAPKLLLRYARFLASRRFQVGFRRERFEHVVAELLTVATSDGRLRLLPRDKARPVLFQLLNGTNTSGQDVDRDAAVAYLRESLERLAGFATHEEFFDSGFFLDVHGYKISMRDQTTSPEFLYLSIAINVEIHNRVEAWVAALERLHKANQLSQHGPPREHLRALLRGQEEAVQSVFSSYRHPKERPLQAPRPSATDAKDTKKHTAKNDARTAARRKTPPKQRDADAVQEAIRRQVLKFWALVLVSVLSFGYVLISTGTVSVGAPEIVPLSHEEVMQLSPLILLGSVTDAGTWLRGRVVKADWLALEPTQRRITADKIAKQLTAKHIPNALLLNYKTPAIRIEQGVVTYVDVLSRDVTRQ